MIESLQLALRPLGLEQAELPIHAADAVVARTAADCGFHCLRLVAGDGLQGVNAVNAAMAQAFSDPEIDWFLCIRQFGVFHRRTFDRLFAAVRQTPMAVLEPRQFPQEHAKHYEPETGITEQVCGGCLLIPRAVYEAVGGFDSRMRLAESDVDFSWRVRQAGFSLRVCPQALFGTGADAELGDESDDQRQALLSVRHLAWKWRNRPAFDRAEIELLSGGYFANLDQLPSLSALESWESDDSDHVADFSSFPFFGRRRWKTATSDSSTGQHCLSAVSGPLIEPSAADSLLSVIIRFHSGAQLDLLDEALFSLAVQDWDQLELVFALQNPSAELPERIMRLVEDQPWRVAPAIRSVPVQVAERTDARARLLNRGLIASQGRYFALLDYDDLVYTRSYSALIEQLRKEGQAWAVGGCVVSKATAAAGAWHVVEKARCATRYSIADLCRQNFIPIHSFVIDRARIGDSAPGFNESLTRGEDYDFLLQLAARHPPDFALFDLMVCEYRFRLDGSNTSLSFQTNSSEAARNEWQRCEELIRQRKQELLIPTTAADLAVLAQARVDLESQAARDGQLIAEYQRSDSELRRTVEQQQRFIARQSDHLHWQESRIVDLTLRLAEFERDRERLSYRGLCFARRIADRLPLRVRRAAVLALIHCWQIRKRAWLLSSRFFVHRELPSSAIGKV